MKKPFLIAIVFLLSVSIIGCDNAKNVSSQKGQQNSEADKQAVISVVKSFGDKLKSVPLLAPRDIVVKSLEENYGELVTPELLTKWKNDPQNAPGRLTSSPWPERIDIQTVERLDDNTYEVKGEVIEVTSVEIEKGGAAAKRPVTLSVKRVGNRWLIDTVTFGAYDNSIVYKNTRYGFNFTLPKSWEAYKIITDKWQGLAIDEAQGEKVVETGPMISIRHPEWTSKKPRQDIPIMIFTIDQWNALQQGKFHIGAAPIGPSELGSNSKYVFALPARYNFAFPTGYEEVETILNDRPLQPTEIFGESSK